MLSFFNRLNNRQLNINEITDNILTNREIEHLREMLHEKDQHIIDLTDTLTHFHVSIFLFCILLL